MIENKNLEFYTKPFELLVIKIKPSLIEQFINYCPGSTLNLYDYYNRII